MGKINASASQQYNAIAKKDLFILSTANTYSTIPAAEVMKIALWIGIDVSGKAIKPQNPKTLNLYFVLTFSLSHFYFSMGVRYLDTPLFAWLGRDAAPHSP